MTKVVGAAVQTDAIWADCDTRQTYNSQISARVFRIALRPLLPRIQLLSLDRGAEWVDTAWLPTRFTSGRGLVVIALSMNQIAPPLTVAANMRFVYSHLGNSYRS